MFLFLFFSIIFFFAAYLFWFISFRKKPENEFPILVYHKIGDTFEWGITRQKVRQFEKQIQYLKENGYQSANPEEIFLKKNCQDTKRLLITLDDGYESAYQLVFPILKRYGFSACIFLITGYVGKYNQWDVNWGKKFRHLTWAQIKEMSEHGFCFGSHTVNHPDLTKLEKKYVEYELKRSREKLEDVLSKKVDFLSFPFGKYNHMVEELAQNMGYRKAFTICSSSNNQDSSSFVLERKGMYLFDSPLSLRIKLNGGPLFWIEDLKGRIINAFANGTTLVKKPNYHEMNFTEPKFQDQKTNLRIK